jgi:hypothetical protein
MKEVTLKISDTKYDFFMELISRLGIEVAESIDIPEEHKTIVRERMNTSKTEELIPWRKAREQFTFKS